MRKHKRVQRYTNFLKGRDFALWCVEITGFFIKKKKSHQRNQSKDGCTRTNLK
jgi:hypothetical protein